MDAARKSAAQQDRPDLYRNQLQQLGEIRDMYRLTAAASGDWHVQTVKSLSASQQLTQQIQKQKVSAIDAMKELTRYQATHNNAMARGGSSLREAIKEQQALRAAMSAQMTGQAFGPNKVDMFVPRNLGPELDSARVRYGMINQLISAAARNTINWGKNTQWAGRQITVGMTMPLLMASGLAGALALQTDKQLTNIARVYDTTATTLAGKERELAQLRETSLRDATAMTQDYGVAVNDVLTIQSQLAATGLNGTNLQQYTRETMRIATLGDFDPATAAEMTISLTTAFRDEIQTVSDLTETFDFYNIIAQETSLQIEDIAAAIPRAASAMSALGVSTKEMGVLMVALRESGVDPEVGANALKSATATLLNPPKEAIEYWKQALGKDLPAIVADAGGNLFTFLQRVGDELHGLDPQVVQTAITKTFGKYQFDRATALVTNFGDAMNGVANQTASAMELMGASTEELAAGSAAELERLQNSISFKFKAAIEGVKAALVPFGMTVLQVLTPILDFVGSLISGFNGLSPIIKHTLLALMVGGAVVGPLLMLVGIFANLMGNVVRAGTGISNLFIRFRALTAEEAAATIATRNANSMFDMQARSSGTLAIAISELNAAMRANVAASTAMAAANASAGSGAAANAVAAARGTSRLPADVLARQRQARGPLLPNATGPIAAQMASTVSSFNIMQNASQKISEKSAVTAKHYSNIGRNMGSIAGMGLMAFPLFLSDAEGVNDSFINIAALVGSIAIMFPGMFGSILTRVKAIGPALTAAFSGGALKSFFSNMKLVGAVGMRSGPRAMGSTISALAPKFAAVASSALRVFGPIGILAGGAIIVKNIIDDMNRMEERQRAMASSAKSWADTLGYSYTPGQLPGMDPADLPEATQAANLATKMAEANQGLADALGSVDDEEEAYTQAMRQVIRAIQSGATVEQAAEIFRASLEMMNVSEVEIQRIMVRYNQVDLSNPDEIADQIQTQIQDAYDEAGRGRIVIRPMDDQHDSVMDTIIGTFREAVGGDLTSEARTLGNEIGGLLSDALNNAGENIYLQADAFSQARDEVNDVFSGMFDAAVDSEDLKDRLAEVGVETTDQLIAFYNELRQKGEDGRSELENSLFEDLNINNKDFLELKDSYGEFMDVFLQGMVDANFITQAKADEIRDGISTIMDIQDEMLGQSIPQTMPIEEAQERYEEAVQAMIMSGAPLSQELQLAMLNSYRAQAGLGSVTSVAEGFGDAAAAAASQVEELNGAMESTEPSAEQYTQMLRSAMEGTMSDIYGEASRLLDEQQEAELDGMRDSLDSRMDYYDNLIEGSDDYYDNLEEANETHWDNVLDQNEKSQEAATASAEAYWDNQEKAINDAKDASEKWYDDRIESLEDSQDAYEKEADSRIDALNAEIEAERDAEAIRQKIFDAEEQRIERMAERLNSNIDFNVALNSGDLDQAARISNDISARESGWSVDDQRQNLSDATAARIETLEDRIDAIETEKEARQEAHEAEIDRLNEEKEARADVFEERLEQTKTARDLSLQALRETQEAERAALEEQRKLDQDRLRSSRETSRDDLEAKRDSERQQIENQIESTQTQNEIDKRGLETRLRELQAFTPRNEAELQQHIADVEALYAEYGINLQGQGNRWATFIREALTRNISIASIEMQNNIDWAAVGNQINSRISGGIGITAGDLQFFLRNGRFANVATGGWWGDAVANIDRTIARLQGIDLGRHSGGLVFHNGGSPAFSQADRVGVPRSAGVYPSEVTALLKRGEYVVNEKATRKNYGMLEAINNGTLNQSMMSRHEGGIADTSPLIMGGMGQMFGQSLEEGVKRWAVTSKLMDVNAIASRMADEAEARAAAARSTGELAGGDTIMARLFNTIKRQFPRANLNSGYRPGDPGFHGKQMAVDLGEAGFAGGAGRPYLADMKGWIYDHFRGSTELIYTGLGANRPDLYRGQNHTYNAATQAEHRNHVHWAMDPAAVAAAGIALASGNLGAPAANGSVQQQVQAEAARWGFGAANQWDAINWVVGRESGWNPNAQNPTSTASGLFQHIDGTWNAYKRPGVGAAKMRLAPVSEQAYAGMNYFKGRYGSPAQAKAFWERNHWYDQGGWMMPGEAGRNGTTKPEPVFTGAQWDVLKANIGNTTYEVPNTSAVMPVRVVDNVASGEQNVYHITIDQRGAVIRDEIDVTSAVERVINERESRNGRRRIIT